MNNTKIEWCDSSWNPVTGCFNNCGYCYARKIAVRFGGAQKSENVFEEYQPIRDGTGKILPYPHGFCPTFHRYRLDIPQHWKKPRTVFVCSMADLFGDWIPDEWIEEVFSACEKVTRHRYLFLTKNPIRYVRLAYKDKLPNEPNMWYGSTVTECDRAAFSGFGEYNVFLSIEPLLEDVARSFVPPPYTKWVIIGAETGKQKNKVVPQKLWIDKIIDKYGETMPVFMKDSLIPIMGEENMRREFPWDRQYYLFEKERKHCYER